MNNSEELQQRLLGAVEGIAAVDIHTHVSWRSPFAQELWDLLGDHYLTELAFSAGMDRSVLEGESSDEEMIGEVVQATGNFDNTLQYRWLMDIARDLYGFPYPKLTRDNWQELAEAVGAASGEPDRGQEILDRAAIEKVFFVTPFWEDVSGAARDVFVPVLDANDFVFGLEKRETRKSLKKTAQIPISSSTELRDAMDEVLKNFLDCDCAGVCLELPPHFKVFPVVESDFDTAIEKNESRKPLSAAERANLQCGALFAVAELCNVYGLPVVLMSGSVGGAYRHGIPSGRDLPVADATLRSLLPLFNNFPKLNWCVSVLSGSQAQELSTYGWIIQNVVISGHWRYHSVPEYIERDLAARIQSVAKTKMIGYYSDMSKFEFGYAKYRMYRRILARVLAEDMVLSGRGSEEDAIDLARYLLRDNACRIFGL